MNILVTGGYGFIGSCLVREIIKNTPHSVINVDALTYAADISSLDEIKDSDRYFFEKVDICNFQNLQQVFNNYRIDSIIHLAAESHVDNSIKNPETFLNTNILGTFNLLHLVTQQEIQNKFKFIHVSTDEVFGSLDLDSPKFHEASPYDPSSPYSASKASSDHLVRAWGKTFKLPFIITNCSNNYGPFHFPEKLIPLVILNALAGKPLPVYGDGKHIRDWLYVEDHADALLLVVKKGVLGRSYNIGGENERTNLEIVNTLCGILDRLSPRKNGSNSELITFVADRPGHDTRYAIDPSRIRNELGWRPTVTVEEGMEKTVQWYLQNEAWWRPLIERAGIGERLGTSS